METPSRLLSTTSPATSRRSWEKPSIVFERTLEARAQESFPPQSIQGSQNFLGPLATSAGDTGIC